MLFDTPESGKKSDANGGRKLTKDLTPQQRENRLALLAQHYQDPLNEGESAFDEEGLAILPPHDDCGPRFADMRDDIPQEEGEFDDCFSVCKIEFIPPGKGVVEFSDWLDS